MFTAWDYMQISNIPNYSSRLERRFPQQRGYSAVKPIGCQRELLRQVFVRGQPHGHVGWSIGCVQISAVNCR